MGKQKKLTKKQLAEMDNKRQTYMARVQGGECTNCAYKEVYGDDDKNELFEKLQIIEDLLNI